MDERIWFIPSLVLLFIYAPYLSWLPIIVLIVKGDSDGHPK